MLIPSAILIAYGFGAVIGVFCVGIFGGDTLSPRDVDWEDAPKIDYKPDYFSSEVSS